MTQFERYQIQALRDNNFSLRHIANQLARSASMIAREISRTKHPTHKLRSATWLMRHMPWRLTARGCAATHAP